jgi:2-iminobutanoate/2-iminopropanoate deaminase
MRNLLLASLVLASLACTVAAQRKYINLPGSAPTRPYSDAVRVGDTLYLAGKLGQDPKTNEYPKEFADEVRQCLKNQGEVLKAAGFDFGDVVKVTVFMTDLSKFDDMNKVYLDFFKSDRPARATIGVAGLVRGAHIEIEMVAVKKK